MKFEDAQGMGQQHADTFEVASIAELREVVVPGVYAKVCVLGGAFGGERVWTEVVSLDQFKVRATLANTPAGFTGEFGDQVEYELRNIYNVMTKEGEDLA